MSKTQICLPLATAALLVVLSASGMPTPSSAQSSNKPIVIGIATSTSGFIGPYDDPSTKAAILRIEEINAKGGLLGRKIEYVVRDTRSSVEEAALAGRELAARGVDLMIVSGTYDIAAPSALAAQAKGIISFSLSAADPKQGVIGIGNLAFTAAGAAQSDGIAMAEFAFQKGFRNVVMLHDITLEYTRSTCAGFKAAWNRLAGDKGTFLEESFKNRDASVAAQITRIASAKPDFIFLCSFPPGGASVLRQLRAAGVDAPVGAGVAMAPDFWFASVPNLSNFYYLSHASLYGNDPRPKVNELLAAYKARYGQVPGVPYIVMGYSVVEAWELAVRRAGRVDGEAVAKELKKFKEESLTAGPYTFTEAYQIQLRQPRLLMAIENGQPKVIEIRRNDWIPPDDLLFRRGQYAN